MQERFQQRMDKFGGLRSKNLVRTGTASTANSALYLMLVISVDSLIHLLFGLLFNIDRVQLAEQRFDPRLGQPRTQMVEQSQHVPLHVLTIAFQQELVEKQTAKLLATGPRMTVRSCNQSQASNVSDQWEGARTFANGQWDQFREENMEKRFRVSRLVPASG